MEFELQTKNVLRTIALSSDTSPMETLYKFGLEVQRLVATTSSLRPLISKVAYGEQS
jgi:hypothetical protein